MPEDSAGSPEETKNKDWHWDPGQMASVFGVRAPWAVVQSHWTMDTLEAVQLASPGCVWAILAL